MRKIFDRFFRAAIKLAMLTGVTFTMTACYGVVPTQYADNEECQADTQQVEALMSEEEVSEVAN